MNTDSRHFPTTAIRAAIVIAIIVAASLVAVAAGRSGSSNAEGLTYIALGDSIPSGNELPGDGIGLCQRGADAYPIFVNEGLAVEDETVRFVHLACSGARVVSAGEKVSECLREFADDGRAECALKDLAAQVDAALAEIGDGAGEALVTITIGANDTAWTEPLGILSLLLSNDSDFQERIDELGTNVETRLGTQVERLVDADDDVRVVLTGYYNPLNAESVLYELVRGTQAMAFGPGNSGDEPCTGTDRDGIEHTLNCAERFEAALQSVNRAIAAVADIHTEQASFIPLLDAFRGHESPAGVCGAAEPASGEPWIRGEVGSGPTARPDCFHPDTPGSLAIAAAVLGVISP